MQKSGLTGSRIRQRRLSQGIGQARLAQSVGISPAYLNLIEHNKRRIGGKLLVDLSRGLDVDPASLSGGADGALLQSLGAAASRYPLVRVEQGRMEELAGRFPGWAALIGAQHQAEQSLVHGLEMLNDRLTHDPQLAASLHEVLSVVTAIHATAAILTDGTQIDDEWQARFHRNIYEDSQRLAESAQALVAYLAASGDGQGLSDMAGPPPLPREELEHWLAGQSYHIAALETGGDDVITQTLALVPQVSGSAMAQSLARQYLQRYQADAQQIPLTRLAHMMECLPADDLVDPLLIAQEFGCDLSVVLRRLASLPKGFVGLAGPVGLVICDGSGTVTFERPIDGFSVPHFGAACPLWPLYQALSQPMTMIRAWVMQSGHRGRRFLSYAVAQPTPRPSFDMPQLFESTMLILPGDRDAMGASMGASIGAGADVLPVGSSCRICPRKTCVARREPSILTQGF